MFINSTASSALRPRQGATAECAVSPRKVYSTDTRPVPAPVPQETSRLLPTWVKRTTSTSLNTPARTRWALPPSCSSATPGQSFSVPGRRSRSISRLIAIALVTLSDWPELWPSP